MTATDPYITPELFTPDPDAGALDRTLLTYASYMASAGWSDDAVTVASHMAHIREAVRNPNPQCPDNPAAVTDMVRELAERFANIADLIEFHDRPTGSVRVGTEAAGRNGKCDTCGGSGRAANGDDPTVYVCDPCDGSGSDDPAVIAASRERHHWAARDYAAALDALTAAARRDDGCIRADHMVMTAIMRQGWGTVDVDGWRAGLIDGLARGTITAAGRAVIG